MNSLTFILFCCIVWCSAYKRAPQQLKPDKMWEKPEIITNFGKWQGLLNNPILSRSDEIRLLKEYRLGRIVDQLFENISETNQRAATAHDVAVRLKTTPETVVHSRELGKCALHTLIRCNNRLIFSIIKNLQLRGLEVDSMVRVGQHGLQEAIERHDPDSGYRLATIARSYIHGAVLTAFAEKWGITDYAFRLMSKYRVMWHKVRARVGHSPSRYEMAEALKWTLNQTDKVAEMSFENRVKPRFNAFGKVFWKDPESDRVFGDGEASEDTGGNYKRSLDLQREAEYLKLKRYVNETEFRVLSSKYGLEDFQLRSDERVAFELDMSIEELNCTLARAKEKLRSIPEAASIFHRVVERGRVDRTRGDGAWRSGQRFSLGIKNPKAQAKKDFFMHRETDEAMFRDAGIEQARRDKFGEGLEDSDFEIPNTKSEIVFRVGQDSSSSSNSNTRSARAVNDDDYTERDGEDADDIDRGVLGPVLILRMNFNDKWFNNQKYVTHLPGSEPFLTSRKISSINFLVNIPMANEAKIIQAGNAYVSRIKAMDDNDGDDPNVEPDHSATEHTVDDHRQSEADEPSTARKGSEDFTTIIRGVSDAVEEKVVKDYFIDDPKGTEVFKVPLRDWRGCSYKPLFKPLALMTEEKVAQRAAINGPFIPSNAFVAENMEVFSSEYLEKGFLYDPDLLDDPIMLEDTDRFVSENAGPIISSILLYVNDNELKDSLNDQFRERHPQLPASLTLSRIRALKKRILTFCISIGYEISTVAYAMVNFERLCLKSRVTKANRKLSMAVSLLLAIKFIEYESLEGQSKKKLDLLFNFFDREWDLDKQEILDAEFGAYVMLGFNLHVPYQHIYLIYTRLLKIANKDNISYLGEDMYEAYRMDILQNEKFRELNRLVVEREREERAAAGIEAENESGELYHKSRHDSLLEDEKLQNGEGTASSNAGGTGTTGGGAAGSESGGSAVKSAFNRNFFDLMIQIGGNSSPVGRNRHSLGSESEMRNTLSTPSTPTSAEMRRSAVDLTSLTRSNSTDAQVSKSRTQANGKRSRSSSKSGKKESSSFVQKLLNIPAMLRLSSVPSSPPPFEPQEGEEEESLVGMRPNTSTGSLVLPMQPLSSVSSSNKPFTGQEHEYVGVSLGQAFEEVDDTMNTKVNQTLEREEQQRQQENEQVGLMENEE